MPNSTELAHWSAIFVEKMKGIPGITDVASDQANAGPMLNVTVNREVASSFGILPSTIDNVLDDAFGQRIVSTIFTQLNQYHVVLEVDPRFQYGPEALRDIYLNSSGGQQVPLSTLVNSTIKAGADRHQPSGHVPVGHDLVQPEAGHGARRCGRRHPADREGDRQARLARHLLSGQRAGFPGVALGNAAADRRGADRDLHHPRRSL